MFKDQCNGKLFNKWQITGVKSICLGLGEITCAVNIHMDLWILLKKRFVSCHSHNKQRNNNLLVPILYEIELNVCVI
jgi:hypothetical protein